MKKYLFKHKKALFILAMVFTILESIFYTGEAYIFKNILDLVSLDMSMDKFYDTVLISIVYTLVHCVVIYIYRNALSKYSKSVVTEMKEDIFSNIYSYDLKSFSENNTESYVSIMLNDIKMIEKDYILNLFGIVGYMFDISFAIILLFKFDVKIALVAIGFSVLLSIIPKFFSKELARLKKNLSDGMKTFLVKVKEISEGFETIRTYDIEDEAYAQFSVYNDEVENVKYNIGVMDAKIDSALEFFSFLIQYLVLSIVVYFIIKNDLTIGLIGSVGQLMVNICEPMTGFSGRFNRLKTVKPIIDNVIGENQVETEKSGRSIQIDEFRESICFRDVKFSYDGKRNVLDGINICFEKGKKYAIVGESGSGKSTILKLILGDYWCDEGRLTVDGTDIDDLDADSLSQLISVIQQDVFLFDTTIKNNITLFKDYPEEEIEDVIEKTQFKMLIESLEDGLDTYIGESGDKLSGGERQRISIARAMLKDTPILLLDEATSALDNITANEIEEMVLNMDDTTVISVTHRLNEERLKGYDKILVIRDGKIMEEGKFDKLIDEKEYFFELFTLNSAI
ncbi:ABC transporter ATP-binding protein [Sporanaerobacter acetigenes]|uniref:ABC transporter transmembrane region n=1 Tax=Sporanaerobacter acetigenes DSM 13106 TaxID=1123281 RepID=A0A1M5X2R2_9FIRM|nr:ABC transporter ATP-binding protein [Sporanaerobacter acetigenes]SHH94109.1 ABC transporter transmembrane region [Sporanaerobacter acetigenes DSM 13106]